MFKADGQIPGRIFILWSTVWDPHTKEGEHGQSRISTEESRHRLELVGELQKIRAKATMTLLYPLIISIERFTQWIASPIQPNRSSHEGTPNKYRIPFFHILLSTKEWVFFSDPHLYIHWNQLSLDQVIILANSIIWVFLDQDSGICSTIDGGTILM